MSNQASVIRHICAGHEYRMNVHTGEIANNYGTVKATFRISLALKRGDGILYSRATGRQLAVLEGAYKLPVEEWAKWAIGQTAANYPED